MHLILIFILLLFCSTVPQIKKPEIPNGEKVFYWDEVGELLAALPLSDNNRFLALTKNSKYISYKRNIDKYWNLERKNYIAKVIPWREKNIEDIHTENTVLYPLSGADFINLYHFHPNAKRFIMIGLQNPGHIYDPLTLSSQEFLSVLPNLESLVFELSVMNYYTSKRLDRYSKHLHISGIAPVLLIFMKRLGFTIMDLKQIRIDSNGNSQELEGQEFSRADTLPGVKILFFKKGDTTVRELSFFSITLNNSSSDQISSEGKYLQSQGRFNLILKSAEYILHTDEFREFITSILKKTDRVIEDESGIPLRLFSTEDWTPKVFGRYIGKIPLKKTPNVPYQTDLASLFKQEKPEVLPFNFGYGVLRGKGKSNIIFLKRK